MTTACSSFSWQVLLQGEAQDCCLWNSRNPDNCFSILFTTDISFSLRQENCWNTTEAAPTPTYVLFLTSWPPCCASVGLFIPSSGKPSAALPAVPVLSQAHSHSSAQGPRLCHAVLSRPKPGPSAALLTHSDPEQKPLLLFPCLCKPIPV